MEKLKDVDCWIFDLDNTLYPPSCKLFEQIAARMTAFIMANYGLTKTEANTLRHTYFKTYGTTLRGLMVEHGQEPLGFLDYVHEIDYAPVNANLALVEAIARLPGRKLVFTAGTRSHAQAVLQNLGATDVFESIYDIADAGFIPKPAAHPYQVFLRQHGVEPTRAAFFEDLPENLAVPRTLGMKTILVGDHDEVSLGAHIDYVAPDLTTFLERIKP